MCFAKTPKVSKAAEQPIKSEVVSTEDAITTATETEKKRKGFTSTVATSGMGVTDTANTKKTQLGT